MITAVILSVIVIASITALFLRGFTVKDLIKNEDKVITPNLDVWIVKTTGYTNKMDAYKIALSNVNDGFAEHIVEEDSLWSIVEGVYLTSTEANTILQNPKVPEKTVASKLTIQSKEFKLEKKASMICNEILSTIKKTFNELIDARTSFISGEEIKETKLKLTDNYNVLKSKVVDLQNENIDLKSDSLATIIYSANQSILGLHNLLFCSYTGNQYLSAINTTIAKVIFSLDNF